MLIKRVLGADMVLGAPPDWNGEEMGDCAGLPIKLVKTPEGTFMVSAWEPTPDEIRRMIAGDPVLLWVRGCSHPVVRMTVDGDDNAAST